MTTEKKTPLVETDNDLLPLADPKALGLPFARRTLGRAMAEGRFPTPIRVGGRLYITRGTLQEFKARLAQQHNP
jgi:hypothetical protein